MLYRLSVEKILNVDISFAFPSDVGFLTTDIDKLNARFKISIIAHCRKEVLSNTAYGTAICGRARN